MSPGLRIARSGADRAAGSESQVKHSCRGGYREEAGKSNIGLDMICRNARLAAFCAIAGACNPGKEDTTMTDAKKVPREWENEGCLGVNKEAPFATLFPYPDEGSALGGAGDSPRVLSLNGSWRFNWVPHPDQRPDRIQGRVPHGHQGTRDPRLKVRRLRRMGRRHHLKKQGITCQHGDRRHYELCA